MALPARPSPPPALAASYTAVVRLRRVLLAFGVGWLFATGGLAGVCVIGFYAGCAAVVVRAAVLTFRGWQDAEFTEIDRRRQVDATLRRK